MQNRCYIVIVLLCLLYGIGAVRAQVPGPVGDLFRKIKEHNSIYMAYDYEIQLKRLSDGTVTDSVRGHLCNGPDHYRDSNAVFLTLRSGNWYCKLNFLTKTATLYDLKQLSQRMKLSLGSAPADPYGITEALLSQSADLKIDTGSKAFYRLDYGFRDQKLRRLQLVLKREDYSLVEARFEAIEDTGEDDTDPYVRIYRLYNVNRHAQNQAQDLSGIFRLERGKVILAKPYANYTLNELAR